jgi:hypothetical protein
VRSVVCVLLVAVAASAHASPNRVSLDGSAEIGVLSASRGKLTAGYTRRFWDERVYAEAQLASGTTGDLVLFDERAGVGLVFRRREPVELQIGWRVGQQQLRGSIGSEPFKLNLFSVELVVQIGVAITDRWRLRVVPLGPTVYWNRSYAGSLGLEAGVDYAF